MKIAISSDNHLDVNRINSQEAIHFQANWLSQNKIDYYLFAGDLFNDFSKTNHYFDQLQQLIPNIRVYYVAGNHDLLNNISFIEAEALHSPLYLHNRFIDIPNSNWRIIGNNGWYDYSFSNYHDRIKEVQRWKNVFWLDSSIEQPISDQERMQRVLNQVKHQLFLAKQDHKRVIFITHFAPQHELLSPKPQVVNTPRKEKIYQMVNAMMGSDRLGKVIEDSGIVKSTFYGHLHGVHPPLTRHNVTYFNQAVGVNNKRINEWQTDNFFEQWTSTIRIINLS
ncbi:metallophosphoesterase [Limosilactobacillus fastidiosus]|uniref:Metallophosphoesterase n=1 Tax=Limosilactobacillus fastidiosus TaxID=2759855 RepID=A0A7W3TZN2_9LACO|nr:metallophosphoesterase [Limosilactobacillus fastidiosus]MBB1062989.1 metallophosphoesterase [Limosilactobacillus fastidiosus]MBB1086232.1 metallophosphoesterase [Limosilactobacillus fastidiosus]MCD7084534.1 metallophosphoesterase [Limosilactobacillus fastidiosus]MCD7086495.1 metallophosphoesterase [Limosilactobacillus fastidiosus]MCD7114936.1 metallophosphoesterase [Limosilactobacillus fastidiosus]